MSRYNCISVASVSHLLASVLYSHPVAEAGQSGSQMMQSFPLVLLLSRCSLSGFLRY